MANETPSLPQLKMEGLIELVQSDPGLYNQTKKDTQRPDLDKKCVAEFF